MEMDYFEEENELVRKLFNLEDIMVFNKQHDVQIIRGEDWQYGCYIDKECYYNALTHLGALVFGIKMYKDGKDKSKN